MKDMWKCSNCGEICTASYCDKCGLPKEESVFDEIEEIDQAEIEKIIAESSCEIEAEKEEPDSLTDSAEFDEYEDYVEDAYAEPQDLIASKRVMSKKEAKAEKKREKRVAELEDKLKKEKFGQQQIPLTYKYEIRLKHMKKVCITAMTVTVLVCAGLLAVIGFGAGSKIKALNAENSEQKANIGSLNEKNGTLETENAELRELKESVRVLEIDGTYHMYGCSEIKSGIIRILDKEQVVGNSIYDKCDVCN